jgi:VWFA-related protein
MPLLMLLPLTAAVAVQPPAPTIRVTTRLVLVNVIVRSKNQPVAGLTAQDFEVLDRGKPQRIAFFSVTSAHPPAPRRSANPPSVFSNRGESQSESATTATVLLLDGLNTERPDQVFAKGQVLRFLDRIESSEPIGLYALGRQLHVVHDFTDDREHLAKVLALYRGEQAPWPDTPEADLRDIFSAAANQTRDLALKNTADYMLSLRVRETLAALEAIARHLARVPGRKNLIWVSGSFPIYPGFKVVTGTYETSREHSFTAEVARTARLFNDANMAICPVDARGLFAPVKYSGGASRGAHEVRPDMPSRPFAPDNLDSAKLLAERTGGVAYYGTNDISGALRGAFEDAQLTYTLGFYPSPEKPDGKFHPLQVRVNRKGVEVRHRGGYTAVEEPAASKEALAVALKDALWSPVEASTIELIVRAEHAGKPEAGALDLGIGINPRTFALEPRQDRWVGSLDVVLAQFDAQGRALEAAKDTVDIDLTRERFEGLRDDWLTLRKTVKIAPQCAAIRVVVQDRATGNLGSVHVPLRKLGRGTPDP